MAAANHGRDFSRNFSNLETFALLWLDATVNSREENRYAQEQLRSAINYLKTFEEITSCQEYIQSCTSDDRLVLIVSGRLAQEIVPVIHPLRQVSSIYIYCFDKQRYKQWSKDFPKIKSILVELDQLISRIKSDQNELMKIEDSISFNTFTHGNKPDQTTTDLNGHFVHTLLLLDVLLRMKPDRNDRKELIRLCQIEYQGNAKELRILDEFAQKYRPKDALWWYTRESFLYKILNKALRAQNIEILFLLRFFIRDICKLLKSYQSQSSIRVYRGQMLSNEELIQLQNSQGKLISINSFFSTTADLNRALEFLKHYAKSAKHLNQIFFIIDADPAVIKTKPFADISSLSFYPQESEVLFMIGSIFRLRKISQNEQSIWIIELTLCEDEEHDLNSLYKYLKSSYIEENQEATLYSFGCILHRMGKLDQAEICFYHLLDESNCELSKIYYALGLVTMDKDDYQSSLTWLFKSVESKEQSLPTDYKNLCGMYNAIGNVYRLKHEYSQAMIWYNKGIKLLLKENYDNELITAHLYNNLAVIYQEEKQYSQALKFYEKALLIREKHLPANHSDIGLSYNNIGTMYSYLGDYELAVFYLNQSIEIKLNSLPLHHPQIGKSYKNLAFIYENLQDWKAALEYFKKARKIYRYNFDSNHQELIKLEQYIDRIKSKLSLSLSNKDYS